MGSRLGFRIGVIVNQAFGDAATETLLVKGDRGDVGEAGYGMADGGAHPYMNWKQLLVAFKNELRDSMAIEREQKVERMGMEHTVCGYDQVCRQLTTINECQGRCAHVHGLDFCIEKYFCTVVQCTLGQGLLIIGSVYVPGTTKHGLSAPPPPQYSPVRYNGLEDIL